MCVGYRTDLMLIINSIIHRVAKRLGRTIPIRLMVDTMENNAFLLFAIRTIACAWMLGCLNSMCRKFLDCSPTKNQREQIVRKKNDRQIAKYEFCVYLTAPYRNNCNVFAVRNILVRLKNLSSSKSNLSLNSL